MPGCAIAAAGVAAAVAACVYAVMLCVNRRRHRQHKAAIPAVASLLVVCIAGACAIAWMMQPREYDLAQMMAMVDTGQPPF